MNLNRRQWFKTTAGLLLAPAVVQSSSIMPVRSVIIKPKVLTIEEIIEAMFQRPGVKEQLIQGIASSNHLASWAVTASKLVAEEYFHATRHSTDGKRRHIPS